MKGISGNPALAAYERMSSVSSTAKAAKPEAAPPGQPSTLAANVNISTEARQLAAGTEQGVSTQRVEELKATVADGSFQVDARAVAERLVDTSG